MCGDEGGGVAAAAAATAAAEEAEDEEEVAEAEAVGVGGGGTRGRPLEALALLTRLTVEPWNLRNWTASIFGSTSLAPAVQHETING